MTFSRPYPVDDITEASVDDVSRGVGRVRTDTQQFEVLSPEPPTVRVEVEIDCHHLDVTLDEEARVVDITQDTVWRRLFEL